MEKRAQFRVERVYARMAMLNGCGYADDYGYDDVDDGNADDDGQRQGRTPLMLSYVSSVSMRPSM